jgi:hypothetical protein
VSAVAQERTRVRRAAEILVALTESDLRARYGRGPWQLLKWLVDPNDYLRPIAFDVDDGRWDKSHRHDR